MGVMKKDKSSFKDSLKIKTNPFNPMTMIVLKVPSPVIHRLLNMTAPEIKTKKKKHMINFFIFNNIKPVEVSVERMRRTEELSIQK